MVKLGSVVRDIVTGQEGVAMARVKWLYGCERIAIAPMKLNKDQLADDVSWFDDQRIESVPDGRQVLTPVAARPIPFKLGSRIRDRVTGFEGIAVASAEWVSGYTTANIESDKLKEDGTPIGQQTFNIERIELVEAGIPKVTSQSVATSGGPQRDPSSRRE